jgi:hypothetical protein
MGSPRPVRAGTAAEDSDWEPSDGEEGDSPPPCTRSRSPSSGGDAGGAEASVGAKRTSRPRRTRAATDGDVGEGCGVFSRTRGRRSRSASGGTDGAGPPRTMSARRARPATASRRPTARGNPVSSSLAHPPFLESVCGISLCAKTSLDAMVRVRTTTEINRVA